ncbi:class I SAM-dependent methyltransferase [Pseudonocardia abyssalis]|uniref:Class I SAM-dependent methyltransferase n=1 Tax=Pseudonocardia abyssalis TaxID=2792008 RepID=A0ABS6UXY0_9PSEU|nr:class I SAM-dependent methyltransferase [Pseudonocardia abyssalis]MBW0114999.1 class I SAM-dependent methyltransferase [Pseudonocardia abyssalis]MBW0137122.1 class I SAM-dependent methyltransferase [Pseudonocardia abyssalis]
MTDSLPEYEKTLRMVERASLAEGFVRQVELTAGPFLDRPLAECRAVDIGCGYGHGVVELARRCASVVGVEPNPVLARHARENAAAQGLDNVEIVEGTIDAVTGIEEFDLVVLDNVLEHIDDQPGAVRVISRCLRPGGVAFVLVPNRTWPIEVHYGLPFLSWLPLPLASAYLRASGRGTDYRDASYAPTLGRLRRLFTPHPELRASLTLPADLSLAEGGGSPVYRLGVAALRRFPQLWAISKAFLLVVQKAG